MKITHKQQDMTKLMLIKDKNFHVQINYIKRRDESPIVVSVDSDKVIF